MDGVVFLEKPKTLLNIEGQSFGKLTVIGYVGKKKWLCKCDCGNFVERTSTSLKRAIVPNCGCYKKIISVENGLKAKKHGMSKDRRYSIWASMKSRCYYKKDREYCNYGGRGIVVCDEWKNDFSKFLDWCNESGYSDNLTIDRIDVNGNYEPNNCRWFTLKEQENNRRDNVRITYDGKTLTAKQWSEIVGISDSLIRQRYHKGWDVEKILFLKPNYANRVRV